MKGEGCGSGDVGVGMLTGGNARSMSRQWVKGLSRDNQTTERENSHLVSVWCQKVHLNNLYIYNFQFYILYSLLLSLFLRDHSEMLPISWCFITGAILQNLF